MSTQPPSKQTAHGGDTLAFEHISEFELGDGLALGDARYFTPDFDDTRRGKLPLNHVLEVRPGPWHAFEVLDSGGQPGFVLLCHEDELSEADMPAFDQAESPGLLVVDSDRMVAIDATVREQPEVASAVTQVDAQTLPVTVAGNGVATAVPRPGRYPVFTSIGHPRTVVFVSFEQD